MGAMKGVKDEEKIMGPMFPRLHVNDTDKGGPRAPPRNKMALYEQFSIPSQRFNSGGSGPPRPPHNGALGPSTSSSQNVGREKAVFSPFYVPVVPPGHSSERLYSCSPDKVNINSPKRESEHNARANVCSKPSNISENYLPVAERNAFRPAELSLSKSCCEKRSVDQNDFEVPTFVQSGLHNGPANERAASFGTMYPGLSSIPGNRNAGPSCNATAQLHDNLGEPLQVNNTVDLMFKEHGQRRVELHTAAIKHTKEISNFRQSSGGKAEEPLTHAKVSSHKENLDNTEHAFKILFGENSRLLYQAGKAEMHYVTRSLDGNSHRSLNTGENCYQDTEDKGPESRQTEDGDINDDSETSMVDSMSGLDISPDDVVGVIGQKHFWKARKAIVNQQRVFAVQVFELHRLIKVQKLIAGSPHLLLDDHSYFRKPPKASSIMPLPSERLLKAQATAVNQRDDRQKPNQTISCPSNNPAEKACVPFDNSGANRGLSSQNSSYGLYPLNPMPTNAGPDNKVGSWCFPSPGNQWLVPVMSPSEGLVYKPYAGPYPPSGGFMAPIYGGCGPISLPPVAGDFMGAPYRVPAPHQQPGMGVFPSAPNYFPPYGYPVMNPMMPASTVEQANMMVGPRPAHLQAEQTGEVNCNMNSRSSCNISNQKNEARLSCPKFRSSKDSEVQLSTASSPSDKGHKGAERASDGNGALPLFHTAPIGERSEQNTLSQSNERRAHAIKVVPHNRRSASESAARIFQSIQEERRHHDSH